MDAMRRALGVLAAVTAVGGYWPGPVGARQLPSPPSPARHILKVRVLDGTTNEPISGVSVDFRCFDAYPRSTRFIDAGNGRTDERGETTTTLPEPGVCIVMNTLKPGFLMRLGENGRPTEIEAGETVRVVHIWKEGRLEGRLFDQAGQPVVRAPVHLAVRDDLTGRWSPMPRPATTDDRGAFHFEALSAERTYSLIVPTMTLIETAPSIVLRPGESRTVELRARPASTFSVSGRAAAATRASAGMTVYLDRGDSSPVGQPANAATARTDSNGRFTFASVPRGDYQLRVDTGAPGGVPNRLEYSILWAKQPLSVNGDVEDVSLPLWPGPELYGTIRFEGSSPIPTTGRIVLSLESAGGPLGRSTTSGMFDVDAANHFSAIGMLPGRYFLRVALPPDGWRWRLKDAITQGRDVSSLPLLLDAGGTVDDLVVTFTDRQTDVSGTVHNQQGAEDGEASVLVFSTDDQFWMDTASSRSLSRRLRAVLTNQHGRFAVPDLPPGEYFIAAVATPQTTSAAGGQDILSNVGLLRQLSSRSTKIRVEYDRPLTQDLVDIPMPLRFR
jgi:hypothetical protein